jgi:hypothetical protein
MSTIKFIRREKNSYCINRYADVLPAILATMDDSYIQYGNAGWFSALDLGMSQHVVGRCRMNIGLSTGVHQAFLGTSFLTAEGEVINFGRTDYLCGGSSETPAIVRTVGLPDFWDSLEPSLKVKIVFSF